MLKQYNGITFIYTQPVKPMQNGLIERLRKAYHNEVLDAWTIERLSQVRKIAQERMRRYNHRRLRRTLLSL